jgi:hypothetical protein
MRVFGRQLPFALGQFCEAFGIVAVPEIELQVLGAVLDVEQVVEEVAACHRLQCSSCQWRVCEKGRGGSGEREAYRAGGAVDDAVEREPVWNTADAAVARAAVQRLQFGDAIAAGAGG